MNKNNNSPENAKLVPEQDFYFENGRMVLTEKYLFNRGYCCENGCRHCPYGNKNAKVPVSRDLINKDPEKKT